MQRNLPLGRCLMPSPAPNYLLKERHQQQKAFTPDKDTEARQEQIRQTEVNPKWEPTARLGDVLVRFIHLRLG